MDRVICGTPTYRETVPDAQNVVKHLRIFNPVLDRPAFYGVNIALLFAECCRERFLRDSADSDRFYFVVTASHIAVFCGYPRVVVGFRIDGWHDRFVGVIPRMIYADHANRSAVPFSIYNDFLPFVQINTVCDIETVAAVSLTV